MVGGSSHPLGLSAGASAGGREENAVGWRRALYTRGAIDRSPTTYLISSSQWTCELDAFMVPI